MISSTMIEPIDTGNPCVIVADFGKNTREFKEADLLKNFKHLKRSNWKGSMWPPVCIPHRLWMEVGGLSIEYPGGFYTDPDLAMKLWSIGVRTFIGVGDSLVYHFSTKTTSRLPKKMIKKAKKLFKRKWGISARRFKKYYLELGKPL